MGINFILEYAIIMLCQWVGFTTSSELMKTIVKFVFIAEFINTGILISLVNMKIHIDDKNSDSTNLIISLIKEFNGKFDDYTSQWFSDVGQ